MYIFRRYGFNNGFTFVLYYNLLRIKVENNLL